MPATLWDVNNKTTSVTLSGGSLIATGSTGSAFNLAATRNLTGKTYFEITATTMSGVVGIGLGGRNFSFNNFNLLGFDTTSVCYRNNGTVLITGATVTTIQTFTQGNVIQVAFDNSVYPPQIYFNVNNGNWNNSSSNNPATGVGGISLSTMIGAVGSPLLPGACANGTTPAPVLTAAFSAAGWTYSAPSGFSSPDTTQATGYNADTNIGASFTSTGPVRKDPVTTVTQRSVVPAAANGWYGKSRTWTPAATAKSISGTVTDGGVAAAKMVRLYDRASGELLYQTTSSAVDGSYIFANLNPAITYDVIAFDLPSYDALIFDNVAPA